MALKGRYYEDLVKSQGFERATKQVVRELIEQHNVLERTLVEYAQQHDKMVDLIQQVVNMGGELKEAHGLIISRLGNEVDGNNPIVEN